MIATQQPTPIERDKTEIDPDIDFAEIARRAWDDIAPREISMFKWTGIYHQLQKGFFMMRVRIPGGLLSATQLNGIADIAGRYGQGQLCLTTRQCVQMHWLRKDDLATVLRELAVLSLDTKNACGDVTRTVVTCPLQGVCPHEVGDVRSTLLALANDPVIRDAQRNLPRKHKISVAGCNRGCAQTLINCQGWYPLLRTASEGSKERGFALHAGGGLGARPVLAKPIFSWVPEPLVVPVARAIVEHFRRHGDRRHRGFARLKFVVEKRGPARFAREVLDILREQGAKNIETIEVSHAGEQTIEPSFLDGQTVIPQRQAGLSAVRLIVPRGEITSAEAHHLAAWASEFGDGTLTLTARQNIVFRGVANAKTKALTELLRVHGYGIEGLERAPDSVACVGTTLCNLAVADTPNTYRRMQRVLAEDPTVWKAAGYLRIHLNGCPNSCAQHAVADIGLRGTRHEQAGGSLEGFTLFVGGSIEGRGRLAVPVCDVPNSEVPEAVRRLLHVYVDRRLTPEESFGAFTLRLGVAELARELGQPQAMPDVIQPQQKRLLPIFNALVAEVSRDAR
jgi:ferredoxin-nitrite reductase